MCLYPKLIPNPKYRTSKKRGYYKPSLHDARLNYSPEMLHRCTEDVMINVDVYHALMAEGKGQTWKPAHMMTFKLFENLQKQVLS